jgi:hypothetical protein
LDNIASGVDVYAFEKFGDELRRYLKEAEDSEEVEAEGVHANVENFSMPSVLSSLFLFFSCSPLLSSFDQKAELATRMQQCWQYTSIHLILQFLIS